MFDKIIYNFLDLFSKVKSKLQYYILVVVDWKIFLLTKFKRFIRGEKKISKTERDWLKGYAKWKKEQNQTNKSYK
jgi:hypothetical protein